MKLIEVLMLSYNHAEFIERAIDSVAKQKSPKHNVMLSIIDDGSTDGTVQKILSKINSSGIKINLIQKKHGGITTISKNLQELIDKAEGDYLAFLSSDDEYLPNRFSEQSSYLDMDYVITYANGINKLGVNKTKPLISSKECEIYLSQDATKVKDHLTSNVPTLYLQGTLMKRNFIQSFQAFDKLMIADDWVFNIRTFTHLAKTQEKFRFLDIPVFYRGIHSDNTSTNPSAHYQRVLQVAQKYCGGGDDLMANFCAFQTLSSFKRGQFLTGFWFLRRGLSSQGFFKKLISKIVS